jgi:hypothetical protein
MIQNREEIERKLEQSRRLVAEASDPTTQERIRQPILDPEQQFRDLK